MNYDYVTKLLKGVEEEKQRTRQKIAELRAEAIALYDEGKHKEALDKFADIMDLQRYL